MKLWSVSCTVLTMHLYRCQDILQITVHNRCNRTIHVDCAQAESCRYCTSVHLSYNAAELQQPAYSKCAMESFLTRLSVLALHASVAAISYAE